MKSKSTQHKPQVRKVSEGERVIPNRGPCLVDIDTTVSCDSVREWTEEDNEFVNNMFKPKDRGRR